MKATKRGALLGIGAAFVVACGGTTDTTGTSRSTGGASSAGGSATGGAPASGGQSSGGSPSAGGHGTGGSTGGASSGGASAGGGNSGGASSGDASSGGASSGGSGGVGSGGAPRFGCPATAPANGAPCSGNQDGATCTWGDSPQPSCRQSGSCNRGKWTINSSPAYCTSLPAACPSSAPSAYSTCSDDSLNCLYPDQTMCSCLACQCQVNGCHLVCPFVNGASAPIAVGTKIWYCGSPPSVPANSKCPKAIPNDGSSCDGPYDEHCPQGWCSSLDVACVEGRWKWSYPTSGCPICASPDTPIATPEGERPIASIAVGDLVYSVVDEAIVPVPVVRVGHTRVFEHHVVRVKLSSGRVLEISPGHPTADGRLFNDLRAGGTLDGTRIESAEIVPYEHAETFDILPASEGGTYFAAGVRIGSTWNQRADPSESL